MQTSKTSFAIEMFLTHVTIVHVTNIALLT